MRWLWSLALVLLACDDAATPDTRDAQPDPLTDAAPLDATQTDATSPDATPPDATPPDPLDATPPDANSPAPRPLAPLMTELVASNASTLLDEDGDASDWIELYNPHPIPILLGHFALSDGGPGWRLPDAELAPFTHRVVFASGKDRRGAEWHTDFRIAAAGEAITLTDGDGAVLQRFDPVALDRDSAYGLPARAVVPPDASVAWRPAEAGEAWVAPPFSAADWEMSPMGLGVRVMAAPSPLAHQTDHLVADWRFDADAEGLIIDRVGRHPGRLAAGAQTVETERGGPALGPDGGWMAASDPEGFDFAGAFTWSLWLKGVDDEGALISRNPAGSAWNQGSKALFVRAGRVQWDSGWVGNPDSGVDVTDDAWHHVAVTYDPADDAFVLYVDGVPRFDRAFDVDRFAEDAPHLGGQAQTGLFIGQAHFTGGLASLDKYAGRIDDVTLWQVALPPEDVALLADGVRPGPVDPYGARLQTEAPEGPAQVRLAVPEHDLLAPHLGVEVVPGARWWVDGAPRAPLPRADPLVRVGLPSMARLVAFALDADQWFLRARVDALASAPERLATPTPGAFNARGRAPAVRFDREDGLFVEAFDLVIEAPFDAIHYTLDGSPPTADSPRYVGPVRVEDSVQVSARVLMPDRAPGPVGQVAFVRSTPAFAAQPRPLPALVLARLQQGPATRTDSAALLLEFAPDADAPTHTSRATMRVRGQSSSNQPKRPYRVELQDAQGDDRALPLLGLPAEADWVLHAPFTDQSLIRNALVYGLGRDMGLTAPRWAFCELYVQTDGEPLAATHARGVYLLVETIERGGERLDLSRDGYLLKFEAGVAEPPVVDGFRSLEIDRPDPATDAQRDWIAAHLGAFSDALRGPDFAGPTGYAAFIDVVSFIDQMVINELFRDQDAYVRSAWLHLEPDGPITMGPLWDYNLSAGTGGFFDNTAIAGWQWRHPYNRGEHEWFARLMADPAFAARFAERWRALRGDLLSDAALAARITELARRVEPLAARNFALWPTLGRQRVNGFVTPRAMTWEGQVEALRGWLQQRLAWIDAALP